MNSDKVISTSLEISEWFESLDENIDLWITDPPYPFDNKNGSVRFGYKDGEDSMYNRMSWNDIESFCTKAYNKSNDGARFYMFCNRDGIRQTWKAIESSGWKFRNILVWDKKNMGMGYHWRNQAEYIFYASRGKPKTYVKSSGNIFSHKKPRGVGHSAKPSEIWSEILNGSLCDGDVCADPFSGSNPFLKSLSSNDHYMDIASSVYLNTF
jgi:site-specific DNA-methyltransferase (adenine-specific)